MIYATPNKFGIVVCVFLNGSEPGLNEHGLNLRWFAKHALNDRGFDDPRFDEHGFECRCVDDQGSVRSRPLFRALHRRDQIFNHRARKLILNVPVSLLRTRPCFVFSWPLRENSTTELRPLLAGLAALPKSLPGTPYHHRTGSPAVSPDKPKLDFRRVPAHSLCGEMPALRPFGRAHLRAARPRIAINLFFPGRHRLFRQQPVQPCFAPSRIASLTILSSSE